ncbi:MAG: phytoene desaturase family protein [Candidatus Kariarchaeaceae archaeon]
MSTIIVPQQAEISYEDRNSNNKVIIIGSGFAGLATAIRLQHHGFKVTILERLDQIGGRGNQYQVGEFKFDAGPTVITAPFLFEELFQMVGKNLHDYVELLPVEPYYRIYFADNTYFDYSSPEKNIEQIKQLSPGDVKGYQKMVEKIKPIFDSGFRKHAFHDFPTMKSMVKIAPELLKLGAIRSNYGFVSKYIKNEKLRRVFSFHPLLIGGNPFSVPSIYSLIQYLEKEWGVWFARGGTYSLVQAMAKLFNELGGKIQLNTSISQIIVEEGKVRGVISDDNIIHSADYVVSNADIATTYTKMIDPKWRKKNKDKKFEKAKYSMSLFLIYFGTKKQYPELKHHMILLGDRYEELLNDIFEKKILPEDFSAYLHAPARTDPTMAPEGKDAFYILVPVPNLRGNINWPEEKPMFRDKIIEFLDRTVMPELSENIIAEKVITPNDFKSRYQAMHGSAFSLEPVLTQSAYFRPNNRSEDIENLYFVGAGTHPGAGLPGVVASAQISTDLILEDHQKVVI